MKKSVSSWELHQEQVAKTSASMTLPAICSWLLPAIAWVSQYVLVRVVVGSKVDDREIWLIAATVQFVLIIVGFYFGLKVLSKGSMVTSGLWCSALVGVCLSGGTIVFILVLGIKDVI